MSDIRYDNDGGLHIQGDTNQETDYVPCHGCYCNPCECLPDDCNVEPE